MNNWWDNLWLWTGWQIGKWFFGFLILWFVLIQIWNEATIPNYEQHIIKNIKSINIELPEISMPHGLFRSDRMILPSNK